MPRFSLHLSPAAPAWGMVFAATLAQLALLGLPFAGFEWAFADAARSFSMHGTLAREQYCHYAGGTLGMPYLAWLLWHVLPVSISHAPRIVSIAGFAVLGAALLRLNNGKTHPALLLALVFINPLVWTYGSRGTADFFPAALALAAVALPWTGEKKRHMLLTSALLGVAITLNYYAALALPLLAAGIITLPKQLRRAAAMQLPAIGAGALLLPVVNALLTRNACGIPGMMPPVVMLALLAVPPLYSLLLPAVRRGRPVLLAALALASLAGDAYLGARQIATGDAAMAMTQKIIDLGLLTDTDPGAMEAQAGNYFFPYRNKLKHYAIAQGHAQMALFTVSDSFGPVRCTYSLVALDETP